MTVPEAMEELRRACERNHEAANAAEMCDSLTFQTLDPRRLAVYRALASLVRALIEEGRK